MANILRLLEDVVGPDYVSEDPAITIGYSRDQHYPFVPMRSPDYVILPDLTAEVQAILRIANRHKIPVIPYGSGNNIRGLCIPTEGGILMDLRRMDRVIEVNPEMSAAVIEPGVVMGKLVEECSKKGVRPSPTAAPAVTNPTANYMLRGVYQNQWRDGQKQVLTMEIVLPNGELLHTGTWGHPGGTPYCEFGSGPGFTEMFMNQPGTMGVITKMAVKLYPMPKYMDWCIVGYNDAKVLTDTILKLGKAQVGSALHTCHWLGYAMGYAGVIEEIPSMKEFIGMYPMWVTFEEFEDTPGKLEYEENIAYPIIQESDFVHGGEIFPIPEDIVAEIKWGRDLFGWFRLGYYWSIAFNAPVYRMKEFHDACTKLWVKHGLEADMCGFYIAPLNFAQDGQFAFMEVESFYNYATDPESTAKLKAYAADCIPMLMNMGISSWFRIGRALAPHTLPLMGTYGKLWRDIKDLLDPNDIMNPGMLFRI